TGRVDRVFAGAKRSAHLLPAQFLDQGQAALDADDELVAGRMHLPAGPVLGEAEARDQPPGLAILGMARGVVGVPLHRPLIARELGLRHRGTAVAEMHREALERARGHAASARKWYATSLLPAGSRK